MSKVVPPSGSPDAPLWLIGEAPGQREVIEGEPFVGPAGKQLRRFCMTVGIDPTECYIDNLHRRRAPADKLQKLFKNGEPNEELSQQIRELDTLIEKHRPNLVVALGAIPAHILTGNLSWSPSYKSFTSIQDYRGSVYEHPRIPGQKVISTFHPAYIAREGYADHGIFLADLSKIMKESAFPEIRRPKKELILNPRGGDLYAVRDRLIEEGDTITVDIEYTGRLLCVGFTSGADWATSIGIHSESDLQICKEIIECGKPLNMQNAMFDCSILEWHYGIEAFKHLSYDTMLAAHAIDPELPKGLDFLCSIYTDQPYYKDMVDWKKIKNGEQDFSILYEYNAIDAWTQHEIMEKQLAEDFAAFPDRYKTFQFEMALVGPLWEMSRRGIKVDPELRKEYAKRLELELEIDRAVLRALNGGLEVNVKSGDDVASMLFDYLKLKPGGRTKTGKFKCDDKTLASALGRAKTPAQKNAIKHIRSARQKRDLLSKFVDVELDSDGRTRGMYNPGGTVTGRLASKKFYPTGKGHQQQNIPRSGRHIIVADDGMLFGQVDKERAESLVVAHLTNDPIMLEHHAPEADAHTLLAQMFFDKEEITGDERFIMKKTRHAGNYMEGYITFMRDVNRVAHITGVSVSGKEAKKFIEWYREVHIGLKPWWLAVKNELHRRRQITNLLGRVRTFYQRVDTILPEAVAYNPQGTVGDLLNLGLLNMHGIVTDVTKDHLEWWEEVPEIGAELKSLGFQALNQVHDSIGFQFPPKNEERITELIFKCLRVPLRNPHTHEIFFIGDELKIGKSWGKPTKEILSRNFEPSTIA